MTIGRWRIHKGDVLIALLAASGVLAFVLTAEAMHAAGFPLDDAWIHQTYARNLATRGEWAFVPGELSAASTSPLYTVLLAIGYILALDFFVWAFVLGAVALAIAGWVGSRLAVQLYPDVAWVGVWTGLAIVTTWHLVWAAASGMETMLFATLSLLVVGLAWRERAVPSVSRRPRDILGRGAVLGVAGAALTLARPEGVGLVALTGVAMLLAWPHGERRLFVVWAGGVAGGWLIGVVPYLALNVSIEGTLLPNTSAAKQAEYAPLRDQFVLARYARLLLPIFAGAQIMLLPGMIAGIAGIIRRTRGDRTALLLLLPAVWAAVDLSAYALRLPATYQHGRYVMPILPHLILYGVGGTLLLVRQGRHRRLWRVLSRSLALTAVLLVPGFFVIGARQYGADVRIINTEMVATAQWVAEHVPPDELLAVHDIGAVGYYAPRPILDLAGLINPEVVPVLHDGPALMTLLCEKRARYLMVFPDQLPVPEEDPRLGEEPVFSTNAPYAPEAGGGNMAVYALQWRAACE